MTLEEIKDAADMAEKWNGAYKLNFEELPFNALAAWVALNPHEGTFDVESVKDAFESWWREERERE
jgi:hypothetical protein